MKCWCGSDTLAVKKHSGGIRRRCVDSTFHDPEAQFYTAEQVEKAGRANLDVMKSFKRPTG